MRYKYYSKKLAKEQKGPQHLTPEWWLRRTSSQRRHHLLHSNTPLCLSLAVLNSLSHPHTEPQLLVLYSWGLSYTAQTYDTFLNNQKTNFCQSINAANNKFVKPNKADLMMIISGLSTYKVKFILGNATCMMPLPWPPQSSRQKGLFTAGEPSQR